MHADRGATNADSAATASIPPGRLLLLGCSKAKTTHDGLVPAIERYDGPAFRVLRRYLRQRHDPALRIFVLSAEFGLVPSDHKIPRYDRLMTVERAQALRSQIHATLDRVLPRSHEPPRAADVLVVASKIYLGALSSPSAPDRGLPQSCIASGSQGGKLAALHDWLYGAPPIIDRPSTTVERTLRFRGNSFVLDREGVLDEARRSVAARAIAVNAWAVVIDGRRIAPKWLVSQATGVPVSGFSTNDAISLLARLGIEVERV